MKFAAERSESVAKFLSAYNLMQALETPEEGDAMEEENFSIGDVKIVETPKDPYDEELQEGQIRVLPNMDRLTFVALMKKWDDYSYIIMPFSRYNDPATVLEIKTTEDGGMFQRVLQAWNARTVENEILEKSWVVGGISFQDRKDAMNLWRSSFLEEVSVSDDVIKRTGLPIIKEDDPRIKYMYEECKNFARVDAESDRIMHEGEPPFRLKAKYRREQRELETIPLEEKEEREYRKSRAKKARKSRKD